MAAPPPNDNFAAAATLSGPSTSATGTNAEATKEPGEPNHAGIPGVHSVWWQWTAPSAGGVSIDTCASAFDTQLAVYTGTSVGALTPVASDDDACTLASSVSFVATAGQQYWIAVDSRDEETGSIALRLQPTLKVDARKLTRRGRIDATRFNIEVATGGEDVPDAPRLTLVRGGRRISVDLELDNEGDFGSDTKFRYTFEWSCDRPGRWRWTASVRRSGNLISQEGTFTVPRCRNTKWFVSRRKVVRDFAKDFGSAAARDLRCRAVGSRRGSRAHTWRCGLSKPGFVCSGGFRFRYTRVFQGRDLVESNRAASGSVTCHN